MLSAMLGNLRYAARSLLREPGYTLAFVLTLGLGIGANTAIFSVINGVLLRPLPYPDAERITHLSQPAVRRGIDDVGFSFMEVADYREQARSLEEVVEFGDWTFIVQNGEQPHRANGGLVTANFFTVLGMRPQLGRTLVPEDKFDGAAPVAVLTHHYWQRVFGADPDIVGKILDLTAKQAEVVGVLEPGSHYASMGRTQDFYVNYAANDHYVGASMQDERSHRMTTVFARLAPGASVEAARAELAQIAARLHAEYPDDYPEEWGMSTAITPWKEEITRQARPTLLLLLATAGFVLVIACANVANLTLTRLIRRERELAVRTALGATRSRLRGLLLSETLTLSLAGALIGLVLAVTLIDTLVAYASRFTSRSGEITIDATVLVFTIGVAVGSAVLFAMTPGIGGDIALGSSLTSGGGHATAGSGRRRLQRGLVVAQLAVTFMLLVGAGLLVRTLANLYSVDTGFDLDNVLTLEAPKFGSFSPAEARQFSESLIAEVSAHPGVHSAAVASSAPLTGVHIMPQLFRVEGGSEDTAAAPMPTAMQTVSADFFRTLGTPVLRGRSFDPSIDTEDGDPVVILNESMARHYFGDENPVGRRISLRNMRQALWSENWYMVVGMVADTKMAGLDSEGVHTLYQADSQRFSPSTVLVRTEGDPSPVAPLIVATIRQLDPERPIEHVRTLAEVRSEYIAPQRLNATLFGAFALLALAIATVGIAGVLAFSVSQRTREIGIRVAVGADRRKVLQMVLREGGVLALAGLGIGAIGAVVVSRFLSGLLFEVEPIDPVTFAVTAIILLVVAVTASLVPARRATAVDPMEALRSE